MRAARPLPRATPPARTGPWVLADQALYSLSNFAAGVLVARWIGPSGFGSFIVAFAVSVLVIGIVRSAVVRPFVVNWSGPSHEGTKQAVSMSSGAIVLIGAACGVTIIGSSLAVAPGNSTAHSIAVVGLLLPVLVLQDFWRHVGFARFEPRKSTLNDAAWFVIEVCALVGIFAAGHLTAVTALAAWGTGAAFGAVLGCYQFRTWPHVGPAALRWISHHGGIGIWFGATRALYDVGAEGATFVVAVIASTTGVGALRGVRYLIAPVLLIQRSTDGLILPRLSALRASSGGDAVHRGVMRWTAALVATYWTYAVALIVLGRVVLEIGFGPAYASYAYLVVPVAIELAAMALTPGAATGLRARSIARPIFVAQLVGTSTRLAGVVVLTTAFGLIGAAWATAIAELVYAASLWIVYARHRHDTATDVSTADVRLVSATPFRSVLDDGS